MIRSSESMARSILRNAVKYDGFVAVFYGEDGCIFTSRHGLRFDEQIRKRKLLGVYSSTCQPSWIEDDLLHFKLAR